MSDDGIRAIDVLFVPGSAVIRGYLVFLLLLWNFCSADWVYHCSEIDLNNLVYAVTKRLKMQSTASRNQLYHYIIIEGKYGVRTELSR